MSALYESPAEIRPLEKMLLNFADKYNFSIRDVFEDLLQYIVHRNSPGATPLTSWRHKGNDERNLAFDRMYHTWIDIISRNIVRRGWYDAFGILYMTLVISPAQAEQTGQFYTPADVCDLLTQLTTGGLKNISGGLIGDTTCGSSSTMLAFHANNPGNFIISEDCDQLCCLMTLCNFFIHGVVGEVVWHNTLHPESFFGGWKVNELLYPHGYLTIRAIEKEESYCWQNWQQRRQEKVYL